MRQTKLKLQLRNFNFCQHTRTHKKQTKHCIVHFKTEHKASFIFWALILNISFSSTYFYLSSEEGKILMDFTEILGDNQDIYETGYIQPEHMSISILSWRTRGHVVFNNWRKQEWKILAISRSSAKTFFWHCSNQDPTWCLYSCRSPALNKIIIFFQALYFSFPWTSSCITVHI